MNFILGWCLLVNFQTGRVSNELLGRPLTLTGFKNINFTFSPVFSNWN